MHTFQVSDVERARDPIASIDSREALCALLRSPVEAFGTTRPTFARAWAERPSWTGGDWTSESIPYHPFVAAVHAAFDEHRPLVLGPDAIGLMIAQGFALHVAANAEALRSRIVTHEGRELLSVRRDDFRKGDAANPWPEVFAALSAVVRERTGGLHDLVVANFSTTDATSRAASEVALLAAAQPYFAYEVRSMCGIPEITLEGTVDDWKLLRARVDAIAAYDAAAWCASLAPVLDAFVAASQGDVDRAHWESFYKISNSSGGPYITGWINALLPYVLDYEGKVRANDDVGTWLRNLAPVFGGGTTVEFLPSGLSVVPFLWKYLLEEYRMDFVAGFVGVSQDASTLALRPEIGWAVRGAPGT